MADSLGFWAKRADKYLADEKVRSHSPFLLGKKLIVRYEPLGVVGVIGPWNFPLTLCIGDAIPALMAGNTVVIKPSEVTPLTNMLMAARMGAIGLPKDTYLVATGRGATGAALVDAVDMVMFTGSTRHGQEDHGPGRPDAHPGLARARRQGPDDRAAATPTSSARRTSPCSTSMMNAGQVCQSVERVYVEEPVYDEFVSKVVTKTKALRQGVPGGRRFGRRGRGDPPAARPTSSSGT